MTITREELNAQAAAKLATRTLAQLLNCWDMTERNGRMRRPRQSGFCAVGYDHRHKTRLKRVTTAPVCGTMGANRKIERRQNHEIHQP